MAIVRQPPPVVPIAGYTAADPMRAFQGMQGGIRPQGQSTIGQQAYGGAGAPGGPVLSGNPQFINNFPVSPGVKVYQADNAFRQPPKPALTAAGSNHQVGATAGGLPSLTPSSGSLSSANNPVANVGNLGPVVPALTTAGANHQVGSTIGGVSVAAPTSGTLTSANKPIANVGNIAPPPVKQNPVVSAISSRATSAAPTFSGNKLTPTTTAKLPASPVSSVSALAPTTTPSQKLGGASAFGGTSTSSPSTGFSGFSAADPNRALKMMRGL